MKFDFESIMDRHGMDAIAIDGLGHGFAPSLPREGFDAIPMWVADMNFPTAPSVCLEMEKRIAHPAFGYFDPRDEYFDAIIRWHKIRNEVCDMKKEHIGYENGVLGGLLSALGTFASRGDNILVHSPTYIGFTMSLKNAGYNIVHSPLKLDGNGKWRMDFEDMEAKIKENRIHVAIFCSPHNPTGRVWEKREIAEAMELFKKYDVSVVSDEIWSDILLDGKRHVPTQSVSDYARERTVALYAPSKTFNLAGLIGAYHVIYNPTIKDRVMKESSLSHYNSMNMLSMYALIGAYSDEGMAWTDELKNVLTRNVSYACDFIEDNFKGVSVSRPEGTYMLFPDFTEWLREHNRTLEALVTAGCDVGVAWQNGKVHGGVNHIRMNLALPITKVEEAFERLQKYVINND